MFRERNLKSVPSVLFRSFIHALICTVPSCAVLTYWTVWQTWIIPSNCLATSISVPSGRLALTTLFWLLNPLFGVLMFHFAYQSATRISENISSWLSHHCKQAEVKSIDSFDWSSASATVSGFLCCGTIFFQGRLPLLPMGLCPLAETVSTAAFPLNALWWVTKYQSWVVCTWNNLEGGVFNDRFCLRIVSLFVIIL